MTTPASESLPTNAVTPRAHARSAQLPSSRDQLRLELLAACGFDRDEQIRIMRKVLASAEYSLDATKETPITNYGKIETIHSQPDHQARAKAREQLIDLLGAAEKGGHGGSGANPNVTIPLPPWMKMTFEPAKPAPVVVETVETVPTDRQPAT